MKKLILTALAALSLVIAAPASANTVTMAITKSGYVPKTVSIAAGDAVTFANQDTVAHQVAIKGKAAFTCTTGLVLQPGQSTTCTFPTAGTYSVSDPNHKGAAFKGTITVAGAPAPAISLQSVPRVVTYGGSVTLSGQLSNGQTGQTLTVLAMECGSTAFKQVTTTMTTANGAYTVSVRPVKNTTYQLRLRNSRSAGVLVKVRPKLALRKLSRGRYSVKALAAESFAGKAVLFQRYVRLTGRWITVKTVLLKAGPTVALPINPTTVSQAVFRARVKARLRVRAIMTQAQAGSCYVAGRSNVILS